MSSPTRHVSKETDQLSSPTPHTGVESLMNSLISPGPATPGQSFLAPQWPHVPEWSNAFQNTFSGTALPSFKDLNAFGHQQNGEEYTPHAPSPSQAGPFLPNAASGPSPKASPRTSLSNIPEADVGVIKAQVVSNSEAAADNAKKLKNLRAQLLARKTKESQPSSLATERTPSAKQESAAVTKPSDKTTFTKVQQVIPSSSTPPPKQQSGAISIVHKSPTQLAKDKTLAGLDKLLEEARQEADTTQDVPKSSIEIKTNVPAVVTSSGHSDLSKQNYQGSLVSGSSSVKRAASPELSEGEIRSDEDTAAAATTLKPPKIVSAISKEASTDSDEKSRRESEVEVMYKKSIAASRESQEKRRRASQVDLAYSPLRKSDSAASGKSARPPLDTSAVNRRLLDVNQNSKSAVESASRTWIAPHKVRAPENDTYMPARLKPSNAGLSGTQNPNLGKRTAAGERVDHTDRQRLIDQNEKAAVEYKRALASRPQAPRVISHTETTYMGRTGDGEDDDQRSPKSGNLLIDPDLKDWLELTEYHDENFRQSRLARFRKKRELERMSLQLEEEERLELQQRSQMRGSKPSSDVLRQASMAPSGLPVSGNGIKAVNESDLATGPVRTHREIAVTAPTLKRHHAEDFADPRTKMPRVDTSSNAISDLSAATSVAGGLNITIQPAQPTAGSTFTTTTVMKDETSPTFSTIPFTDRISRDDGASRQQRRRTRSPDRSRRRSVSPDDHDQLRRNSAPNYADKRTCHNCGEPGHYQTTCPHPRRDGRYRPGLSSKQQRFNSKGFAARAGHPDAASGIEDRRP